MQSEFLNPAWLASIGAAPVPGVYQVFAVPYAHHGRPPRVWRHRTLKAAGRRLGSVINGKLRLAGDNWVFAMAPDGTLHNWYSANGRDLAKAGFTGSLINPFAA